MFDVGVKRPGGWLIKGGATAHLTPHRAGLFDYEIFNDDIDGTFVNKQKLKAREGGRVNLISIDKKTH